MTEYEELMEWIADMVDASKIIAIVGAAVFLVLLVIALL